MEEVFTVQSQLFSDKLDDLYGHTLSTGFFQNFPLHYIAHETSTGRETVYGVEIYITEASAKAINFSVVVKLWDVTGAAALDGISKEYIDFSTSSFQVVGPPDIQGKLNYEPSIFVYSIPLRLMIRQYPFYKTQIANDLTFIAGVFFCYNNNIHFLSLVAEA